MIKCLLCDKVYTIYNSMYHHRNTHLNIRPYKCPICEKGFFQAGTRNCHVKNVYKVNK